MVKRAQEQGGERLHWRRKSYQCCDLQGFKQELRRQIEQHKRGNAFVGAHAKVTYALRV